MTMVLRYLTDEHRIINLRQSMKRMYWLEEEKKRSIGFELFGLLAG